MTDTSPYASLVNLCYQLRHENEELMSSVRLKSEYISKREEEIEGLKSRLTETVENFNKENEETLAERVSVGNDRLDLMRENARLESNARANELRVSQLEAELSNSRDQTEILLNQLEASRANTPRVHEDSLTEIENLRAENGRLRKEIEAQKHMDAVILRKTEEASKRARLSEERRTPTQPVYVMSAEDSLLRLFESLVGISMVHSDDTVTLVSKKDSSKILKMRTNSINESSVQKFLHQVLLGE